MFIDPRGPRFAAALTTVVLAVVLLTGSVWLLAAQTLHRSPYAALFRNFVRPRLAPPTDLEPAAPPRFAQAVGLGFGLVGTVALAAGATTVGLIAVGLALGAAFLNAAFGFCLGCEIYLMARRVPVPAAVTAESPHAPDSRTPSSATPEEITA
jgi:hypothetical protein